MNADPRVDELLNQWEEARQRGTPPGAEELCRDHPELREEVNRQIAVLERMQRLVDGNGAPAIPGSAESLGPPGRAQ